MNTLRGLVPFRTAGLESSRPHHSLRSGGSFRQIIRRPTKLLETLRKYVVGDPVQFIDWKIYAKSDQILLRERKEESSVQIGIILELNDSMFWPRKEDISFLKSEVPTKAEIAWRVALYLANSHLAAGDFVNIAIKENNSLSWLTPLRSTGDVQILFFKMLESSFTLVPECRRVEPKVFHRTWVISDGFSNFLDYPSGKKLQTFLHLLSSLEMDSTWFDQSSSYFDSHNTRNEFTGETLLHSYDESVKNWLFSFKKSVEKQGFRYLRIFDSTLIDHFCKDISLNGKY